MLDDVIFAKASGGGPAAITVLRLTGAGSHRLVRTLCDGELPPARRASLRKLVDPSDGSVLDEALVLIFASGASYTGEESAELHLHGGEAVALGLYASCERLGARLARPGEFSRRALLNGKLDVAQAESVGALIAAETESERKAALRGLEGEVGALATRWRDALISITGLLETGVDFVEEALGDDLIEEAADRLRRLRAELAQHQAEAERFELRRDRPTVVLIGPPNAGKSSLLNAIAGVDRAIVSPQPGTTRDQIDVGLRIAGRELALVDTAGVRRTTDLIEAQGVDRSLVASRHADRRIFVLSADTLKDFGALLAEVTESDAAFWTKSDLATPQEGDWPEKVAARNRFIVTTADPLGARRALERYLTQDQIAAPVSPIVGSARRIALLRDADHRLAAAAARLEDGSGELAIEDLRQAAERLAALSGRIDQEDVLDALFSRFCIGK